jgi:hypothetical protein
MASTFDLEEVNVPEIIESITALIVAPIIFPIAAAVKQPVVQAAIKEGIALSERCKEAIAETTETIENLVAEVNTDLMIRKQEQFDCETEQISFSDERVDLPKELNKAISNINSDLVQMSNGLLDLRLLFPLGLSALAVRQILIRGWQIDEIPWYALAWYAFDSFSKLNLDGEISEISD